MLLINGWAGYEALSVLTRDKSLTVEACGQNAIYLRTSRDDIIILLRKTLTPFSISVAENLDTLNKLISIKLSAEFDSSSIVFENGLILNIQGDPIVRPVEFTGNINEKKLRFVYNCYRTLTSDSEFPDFMQDAIETVRTASLTQVLSVCGKIVGLGRGYTPEGDDFVGGLFLGLRLLDIKVDPKPIVLRALERSRWPSWKFIEHSYHGCTYAPVYRLCMSLILRLDPIEHLLDALRVGSTTGFATVSGLLETLTAFHSSLSKRSLTSFSSSTGGDQATSTTSSP